MKTLLIIAIIIIFAMIFYNVCNDAIEEFRGRRKFRRKRWARRGINPNRYVRRLRRGWYPRRRYYWYDNFTWPTTWLGWGACKKGCTPEGCPMPGNTYDECIWASDCYGCHW